MPGKSGTPSNAKKSVAAALSNTLADTFQLYLKTHVYHWNVTGPNFPSLHAMFEQQYTEMWAALDVVAERIRALGEMAPAGAAALTGLSEIGSDSSTPDAQRMLRNLVEGHETLIARARDALASAEEADDAASADLLTERIAAHEKAVWMLRATIA